MDLNLTAEEEAIQLHGGIGMTWELAMITIWPGMPS